MNKAVYLREVLGVKNYLCPPSIQKIRQLEGEWPTKILVITLELLSDPEKQLLKKILSSLGFHQYSLLQIKDLSYKKSFILESLELAKFVFVFGAMSEELNSKKALFQTPCSLKELIAVGIQTNQKKKTLWEQLKNWRLANLSCL